MPITTQTDLENIKKQEKEQTYFSLFDKLLEKDPKLANIYKQNGPTGDITKLYLSFPAFIQNADIGSLANLIYHYSKDNYKINTLESVEYKGANVYKMLGNELSILSIADHIVNERKKSYGLELRSSAPQQRSEGLLHRWLGENSGLWQGKSLAPAYRTAYNIIYNNIDHYYGKLVEKYPALDVAVNATYNALKDNYSNLTEKNVKVAYVLGLLYQNGYLNLLNVNPSNQKEIKSRIDASLNYLVNNKNEVLNTFNLEKSGKSTTYILDVNFKKGELFTYKVKSARYEKEGDHLKLVLDKEETEIQFLDELKGSDDASIGFGQPSTQWTVNVYYFNRTKVKIEQPKKEVPKKVAPKPKKEQETMNIEGTFAKHFARGVVRLSSYVSFKGSEEDFVKSLNNTKIMFYNVSTVDNKVILTVFEKEHGYESYIFNKKDLNNYFSEGALNISAFEKDLKSGALDGKDIKGKFDHNNSLFTLGEVLKINSKEDLTKYSTEKKVTIKKRFLFLKDLTANVRLIRDKKEGNLGLEIVYSVPSKVKGNNFYSGVAYTVEKNNLPEKLNKNITIQPVYSTSYDLYMKYNLVINPITKPIEADATKFSQIYNVLGGKTAGFLTSFMGTAFETDPEQQKQKTEDLYNKYIKNLDDRSISFAFQVDDVASFRAALASGDINRAIGLSTSLQDTVSSMNNIMANSSEAFSYQIPILSISNNKEITSFVNSHGKVVLSAAATYQLLRQTGFNLNLDYDKEQGKLVFTTGKVKTKHVSNFIVELKADFDNHTGTFKGSVSIINETAGFNKGTKLSFSLSNIGLVVNDKLIAGAELSGDISGNRNFVALAFPLFYVSGDETIVFKPGVQVSSINGAKTLLYEASLIKRTDSGAIYTVTVKTGKAEQKKLTVVDRENNTSSTTSLGKKERLGAIEVTRRKGDSTFDFTIYKGKDGLSFSLGFGGHIKW